MKTLIKNGNIVNEGKTFVGDIIVNDDTIVSINENENQNENENADGVQNIIDATGCYVLPGIIDDHVHMREPGLTAKGDIDSETRAAAAGGVTTVFDMPNTVPQTTTLEALDSKFSIAATKSHVNYSFFFGATNDNTALFEHLDTTRIPGIKVFMGSSTGNMLVDRDEALDRIFREAPLPLMTHCEDTAIINRNAQYFKDTYGDDPDVWAHQLIRSEEACLASTVKAIELAVKHGRQLHIAHVSTQGELEILHKPTPSGNGAGGRLITAEAAVGHLLFSTVDYQRLGTRIKVNPAIKSCADREELRQAIADGRISVVATDHAPHLLTDKQGGCFRAASGMPMVQFALPAMLGLVSDGIITIERLVELMAHNPARIFSVSGRGFLRKGYKADITIVRPDSTWTVGTDIIESKCGWSPLEGQTLRWRVDKTLCNGHTVYDGRHVDSRYIAQPVRFER